MGEIAEAMLNGDLCEGCGCELGFDQGYPGYCGACGGGAVVAEITAPVTKARKIRCNCPECGKSFKASAISNHIRDAHGGEALKKFYRLAEQGPSLLADLKFLVEHIEENGRLAGKTEQAITNFTATYHATIAKAEGRS
ncbi:MAG: hypothetical protein AXW12_00555 [Thalassospira sp. Nap_22]|nr:MAG: hypothetical protein AXW12_00555 [Thalassospira sp. Nap_22]